MPQPLLFQVNTRCWLHAWSGLLGRPVTLANVPEVEIASWKQRGFTHIWLMGVWGTGPKTRDVARAQANLRAMAGEAFGAGGEDKIVSSPFAVADYTVGADLGGPAALKQFRAQLHRYGVGLVLDFIPNHLGLDHRWLTEKNSLFIGGEAERPECFPVVHDGVTSWVAHGKDPYFPAWIDTAQLDYRLAPTRAAMIEALQSVAQQCDGVRCDMAMLLLNDIFAKTWGHFPINTQAPTTEFWGEAISAVKQKHPQFIFIAEAYWDLEPRLESLGFDYAYDKKFLDHLTRRDFGALQWHLQSEGGEFNPVRFLENHDEARIASQLSAPEQKAAAVLLLVQPAMRLLHDGQLAGKTRRTPVQFGDYWPEPANAETTAFYEGLLTLLSQTVIGRGDMEFCETGLAHCFAMKWKADGGRINLAVVNMATQRAGFQIQGLPGACDIKTVFFDNVSTWGWRDAYLHFELAACGFALLELRQTN